MAHRTGTTILTVIVLLGLVGSACSASSGDAARTRSDTTGADAEAAFADPERPRSDDPGGDVESSATTAAGADDAATSSGEAASATDAPSDAEADFSRSAESAAGGSEDGAGLFDDRPATTTTPPVVERAENGAIRPFVDTADDPQSTFALDVDTGAYTIARRNLDEGRLPPRETVRVEEFVNYFDYGYDEPERDALGISVDGGPSPFERDRYLVRIGVQSQHLTERERPDASLVFVVDTSGSMGGDGKLDMVKDALTELVDGLGRNDRVGIVEFDDSPSVVLEPTWADERPTIIDAIDRLRDGGSTNVEGGLRLGYDLADQAYRRDDVNRVILLSDGVANVGLTDPDSLADMIRRDADRGIQLLTVGVGREAYNDVLMEQLADQGDGVYVFVDSRDEARRVFRDDLTATLVTLAIDAKVQVEFDDAVVERYRLIGFENRGVLDRDFRNDAVDAGEIGAGHQVTAIYEIELAGGVDLDDSDDLGVVRLRWEEPDTGDVVEIDRDIPLDAIEPTWRRTSDSFRLATTVAVFAELLRDSPYAEEISLRDLGVDVDDLADRMRDERVDELSELVRTAASLT